MLRPPRNEETAAKHVPSVHPPRYNEGMGDLLDPEWQEWYQLTPLERWRETEKLWAFYLSVGGSLDPEPDSQSPFDALYPRGPVPADGRTGLRVVRRGGV